jgi:hypothetical protein
MTSNPITLLSEPEVLRRTSLSERTLWRYVANRVFPSRDPRHVRRNGVPHDECRLFDRSRPRRRDSQTARAGRPRKHDLLAIAAYVAEQKRENPHQNNKWAHQSAVMRYGCSISTVFRALREHPDAANQTGA